MTKHLAWKESRRFVMARQWHIGRNGTPYGPYSHKQMREMAGVGELLPTDLVLQEGTSQWSPASQAEAFFPMKSSSVNPLMIPVYVVWCIFAAICAVFFALGETGNGGAGDHGWD